MRKLPQLAEWQEELIVRKWLKRNDYYWASRKLLEDTMWHHLASVCKMPRGAADATGASATGSQQCVLQMDVPSKMACNG